MDSGAEIQTKFIKNREENNQVEQSECLHMVEKEGDDLKQFERNLGSLIEMEMAPRKTRGRTRETFMASGI